MIHALQIKDTALDEPAASLEPTPPTTPPLEPEALDYQLWRDTQISRTMSKILRHQAMDLDLFIRPDMYCRLQAVMDVAGLRDLKCKATDVDRVMRESDRLRFETMEADGETYIRAVTKHSTKIDHEGKPCKLRRRR